MSTAMKVQPDEERILRTKDLALASFLSLNGFGFRLMQARENSDIAVFIFKTMDQEEEERMKGLVRKFNYGEARVEPARFMKTVGHVRGQLYDFLDSADH